MACIGNGLSALVEVASVATEKTEHVFRCDTKGVALAPLLETPTPFNWSVNGIPGGNHLIDRIVADDKAGAIYTAPASKPSKSTVAVSIEIKQQTAGRPCLFPISRCLMIAKLTWVKYLFR
ncbi:hypothetical protein [Sedimenticola selenatireducens]|uniref:Uncharacterized protein n=1 Tax=Sedimenticola selenatireducens TaxID=191960 RepID=A0A558DNV0_9GAMM|nr:hypothetical protein [Sedimenticola selenatireducens]TVO78442.1 hypothetical protein FHP88_01890 [Sedimenticola selenatireducens]TVT62699.1 MAG: hypothetical protein FHK78_13565 [Sedimenticola selenatireducens]